MPFRPPPPRQIIGIDLLRLAAALMVATYHLTYLQWADPHVRGSAAATPFLAYASWTPIVGTGWVGVQIFFVISGFVIAYTANGRSAAAFLESRVLRLVPGMWVCATLSAAALLLAGTGAADTAMLYFRSLVLFPLGPWVASSYWTLPIEIVFYALVLIVLCRDRFASIERIMLWLGGASLVAGLVIAGATAWPGGPGHVVAAMLTNRAAKPILLQHGCLFATGTMIWVVRERGATPARLGAIAVLMVADMLQIVSETAAAARWAGVAAHAATPVTVFLAALALMAASLRWNDGMHALAGRGAAGVRALGLVTYPVYLLHQPIGVPASRWQLQAGVPPVFAWLGSTTLVLILAALVALRIEPPMRRWAKARLADLSTIAPTGPAWATRATTPLRGALPSRPAPWREIA